MGITADELPSDPHAPLSNEQEETEEAIEQEVFEQPSTGLGAESAEVTADGAEAVPGYEPITTELGSLSSIPETAAAEAGQEEAVERVGELYTAPDTSGLADAAVASFGRPPALEAVIGTDDRIRITNTNQYPWRVHASLLITAADNSQWIGTGWFIGPHTLITAGHVVYIKNSGVPGRDGWVRRITVMPGRNVDNLPYGSVISTSFRTVVGWASSGDENYDYGAILLPSDLGNTTGWFGFGVWSDADLKTVTANISGYPGDKPSGTQWYHARRVAAVNPRKVFYDVDTAGGQSGSAVYRIMPNGRYAIAIHAYGGTTNNSGTRIVSPVFANLLAWKA